MEVLERGVTWKYEGDVDLGLGRRDGRSDKYDSAEIAYLL